MSKELKVSINEEVVLHNIIEGIENEYEPVETNGKQIQKYGHYTSVNAFESIANTLYHHDNQLFIKLWFTKAYCTNDRQEASYGYDFMMNSFSAIESCHKRKEDRFLITNYAEELERRYKFRNSSPKQIRLWLTHQETAPYIMSLTRKIIGSCSDSDSIKRIRDAAKKIGIQSNNLTISSCPLR